MALYVAGQQVIELWHDGQFIGQVCGADGPGVRVITKHKVCVVRDDMVTEIQIQPKGSRTCSAMRAAPDWFST